MPETHDEIGNSFFDDNYKPETRSEAIDRVRGEIISTNTAYYPKPSKLPLSDLWIEELVFQQRETEGREDGGTVPYHVDNLLRNLKAETDKRLDPIVIWWTGVRWVILDGHHRHMAYTSFIKEEGESADNFHVPVKTFTGAFDGAFDYSSMANRKVSEPLTANERSNAAWRRVCLDARDGNSWELSKKEIAKRVTVSEGQIGKMRSTYLKVSTLKNIWCGCPLNLSWAEASELANGGRVVTDYTPDEQELRASDLAKRLGKTFGKSLHSDPETFWMAVGNHSPQLQERLIEIILSDYSDVVGEFEE
jgi:hypothetical protein